jgi:excisionase family DNA binding protein
MKYYTAEEAAKKLKVSANYIYDLVKKGEIQKREGMGRIIRIPSSELTKASLEKNYFTYNSEKIEVLETHLGKIRKVRYKNGYVLTDLAKVLGLSGSYSIVKRINENLFKKIEVAEAQKLGLFVNKFGILLISYEGIKEYCSKSTSQLDLQRLLGELRTNEEISIDGVVEEKEIKTNQLQVIEERELLGKDFKIYGTLENPLFLARDVAEWIEHSQSIKMIENVDKEEKVMKIVHTLGGNQSAWFLTEDGLYEVLMQSRKPIAKEFKKEVKKILKQIRLTGGYVGNSTKFVDNYFSNLSKDTRKIILSELENKNKTLMAERVKIDKELLDNIEVIEKIQETL